MENKDFLNELEENFNETLEGRISEHSSESLEMDILDSLNEQLINGKYNDVYRHVCITGYEHDLDNKKMIDFRHENENLLIFSEADTDTITIEQRVVFNLPVEQIEFNKEELIESRNILFNEIPEEERALSVSNFLRRIMRECRYNESSQMVLAVIITNPEVFDLENEYLHQFTNDKDKTSIKSGVITYQPKCDRTNFWDFAENIYFSITTDPGHEYGYDSQEFILYFTHQIERIAPSDGEEINLTPEECLLPDNTGVKANVLLTSEIGEDEIFSGTVYPIRDYDDVWFRLIDSDVVSSVAKAGLAPYATGCFVLGHPNADFNTAVLSASLLHHGDPESDTLGYSKVSINEEDCRVLRDIYLYQKEGKKYDNDLVVFKTFKGDSISGTDSFYRRLSIEITRA